MTLGADPLEYSPQTSAPPGESLKETLDLLGITQADLARRTGLSTKHINQIIQGLAVLTPETAILLERATGTAAGVWNGLEAAWRTYQQREEEDRILADQVDWLDHFPLAELVSRRIVPDKTKTVDNLRRVLKFFGVASPQVAEDLWDDYRVAFRRSTKKSADEYATAVWLRYSVLAARDIECQPFERDALTRLIPSIRALSQRDPADWLTQLPPVCATAGVAVVFSKAIKSTYVSSATRWLTPDKVMVALTDRYKKDDRFWFAFFHEVGHILLHGKRLTFLDEDPTAKSEVRAEAEASRFAADTLIPPTFATEYRKLKSSPKPFSKIIEFADRIGVSPGIVVGRLQHDEALDWGEGNGLKRDFELT
jgi:addiction module HigA family antidote